MLFCIVFSLLYVLVCFVMYLFTTTALPFHCIISAWYSLRSHFFMWWLLTNPSYMELMTTFLHICILLSSLKFQATEAQTSCCFFSHCWNHSLHLIHCESRRCTKYYRGSLKSGPQKKKKKKKKKKKRRTDRVFLKAERTRPRNTRSSSLLFPSQGNEDRLSEFVWHVPLFLPVRSCRSTSAVHMEINCASPQLL